mgnify:CR=1 FL=1
MLIDIKWIISTFDIQLTDVELSKEDMQSIDALNRNERIMSFSFNPQ